MDYEKYLIKKDKDNLLSSLKQLDKDIIESKIKEHDLKNVEELKEYIIENFKFCIECSKDDPFTIMYFQRLIDNENTEWMSVYESDIEESWAFVYENNGHYSYYIPKEIKAIIKKILKIK